MERVICVTFAVMAKSFVDAACSQITLLPPCPPLQPPPPQAQITLSPSRSFPFSPLPLPLPPQAQGAGMVAGSAAAEYTDLALLPGGAGLLAATADARLIFLTATAAAASGTAAVAGGAMPAAAALKMTRQLVGNNDEVRCKGGKSGG